MQQQQNRPADCVMVVFGATGDLARRKLIPSLYHLHQRKQLPQKFAVLGNSRKDMNCESFRTYLRDQEGDFFGDEKPGADWPDFINNFHYVTGDATDEGTFERLRDELKKLDEKRGLPGNYVFYLATAPNFFFPIVQACDRVGIARENEGAWRRFIFEKPFGHDLASARQLNQELSTILKEKQIYRIDHYLGKETVQNIMVMRFANGIFEPIWNRNFIDSVHITVAESLGVEDRGPYYDHSGALRDMVPNHLFQLLSFIAMEPPSSFDSDSLRNEKTKAIRAIRPLHEKDVLNCTVRGQYGAGTIQGKKVPAYREEKKVDPKSNTETYAALKLWLDNWRWSGVPFYLRTGKRLARRISEVRIQFKTAPLELFRNTAANSLDCNQLVLQIQPQERIGLRFGAKVPGAGLNVGCVEMQMDYEETFGKIPNTGYETLLFDCMSGDGTLFQRADQVEASWSVVQPILDMWEKNPPKDFPNYAAGSWGPDAKEMPVAQETQNTEKAGLKAV